MEANVHVHLHARDLSASRDFYAAFFGAPPVKERPGYAKFLPGFAPLNLAISQAQESADASIGSHAGVSHLGLQLATTREVLDHLARAKAAGLRTREELAVDCCHANQDKFWVVDPDGNEWEVYHLNHDLEPAAESGGA